MTSHYALITILIMSVISLVLRAFPFLFFELYKNSKVVTYLGGVLPACVMLILVVYSFRDISIIKFPYGIPELTAVLTVAAVHALWRNVLLSIFLGTGVFALLNHYLLAYL